VARPRFKIPQKYTVASSLRKQCRRLHSTPSQSSRTKIDHRTAQREIESSSQALPLPANPTQPSSPLTTGPSTMAKLSPTRRLLILANVFNLLVAIYFIIIAIVGLAQLRWYHQLTIAVKARYFITLATSYSAFFILILVGLILIGLFVSSTLALVGSASRQHELIFPAVDEDQDTIIGQGEQPLVPPGPQQQQQQQQQPQQQQQQPQRQREEANSRGRQAIVPPFSAAPSSRLVLRQSSISDESQASVYCSIGLHLLVSIGLILILIIWLYNTGELVRDSISGQMDYALARYQFSNRTNHMTIAVDGIQDVNQCCGSLDYTDFPRQRNNGLSPSHYPGSCCGKHVFAAQARVICMADEVVRSRRTVSFN
jgi:hypothetical protein